MPYDKYLFDSKVLDYPAQSVLLRSIGTSPGADSASCVITKPVGLFLGDLMVAQVVARDLATSILVPADWNDIRSDGYAGDAQSRLMWKIATALDVLATNFTFAFEDGDTASNMGAITAIYGHDPTTPINANNGNNSNHTAGTALSTSGITPSVANCMIMLFCGSSDNNTFSSYAIATSDPGLDEAYDINTTEGADCALAMAEEIRPETSATGNGTATQSGSDYWTCQIIAIAPLTSQTYECSCSDGFKLGDSNTSQCVFQVVATDGFKSGDSPSSLASFQSLSSDGLKLSDSSLMGFVYSLLVSEGIKLGDTPTSQAILQALASEGVKLGDTPQTQAILNALASEGLKVGDTPSTLANLQAIASDGLKLGDSPIVNLILYLTLVDGLKLSEALSIIGVFNVLATDGLKLGDTAIRDWMGDIIRLILRAHSSDLTLQRHTAALTLWVHKSDLTLQIHREATSLEPQTDDLTLQKE